MGTTPSATPADEAPSQMLTDSRVVLDASAISHRDAAGSDRSADPGIQAVRTRPIECPHLIDEPTGVRTGRPVTADTNADTQGNVSTTAST